MCSILLQKLFAEKREIETHTADNTIANSLSIRNSFFLNFIILILVSQTVSYLGRYRFKSKESKNPFLNYF